jgi:hypothetical protein
LTAIPTFNTDDDNKPTSGITYQWQYDNAGTWESVAHASGNTNQLQTVDNQDEDVKFRCAITHNSVTVYTNAITMK